MKKYAFILLATAITLVSCSKDKNDPEPDPFKVTKISCTKNGSATEGFSMDITYNTANNTISKITYQTGITDFYIYNEEAEKIAVYSNTASDFVHTNYALSGNKITDLEVKANYPYGDNEEYVHDSFTYEYAGNNWKFTSEKGSRPNTPGSGDKYTTFDRNRVSEFIWDSNNIKEYDYANSSKVMKYEYSDQNNEPTFPFRILNSFSLVEPENFHPLNEFMGSNTRKLLKKAYWYETPEVNDICVEYNFEYTLLGNYITEVTINETIYKDRTEPEENLYIVNLSYGYDPN
ncbi:MAG: DUF5032 domain-containing protein [Tannerellaceae bacterium]|nr:DUF5032 domain-containing protein [Tannerellaceae bacterium]